MNRANKRSNLLLLELIIAILFLSVSLAISVKFFASAHEKNLESLRLNKAMFLCISAKEVIDSSTGDIEEISLLLSAKAKDNVIKIYYNENFNISEKDTSPYLMKITLSKKDNMLKGNIIFTFNNLEIYSIKVNHYIL